MMDAARSARPVAAHDLLRLGDVGSLQFADAPPARLPDWAQTSLAAAPFVVVRRERIANDLIPVGVRGLRRNQRLAALLPAAAIAEIIAPEHLAQRLAWKSNPRLKDSPVSSALDQIQALMSARNLQWGPTGSIGFELASGAPVSHPHSDLDLLLRAPLPLPLAAAQALLDAFDGLPVTTDVQVETPAGAFSLREYASRASSIRLRRVGESFLVRDPWSMEALHPAQAAGSLR